MVTNMKNTVFGFKRLLGRNFSDPHVQKELRMYPFQVEAMANDKIGIRVNYLGEDNIYSPEQVNFINQMLAYKLSQICLKQFIESGIVTV